MLEIHHFFVFLGAGLLLNITPGPDMLYVATRSSTQGKMAGVVSSLGIGTGSLIHVTAAAFGLSAVILYSAVAFQAVKWIGAGYLVFLGIRTIYHTTKQKAPSADLESAIVTEDLSSIYRKGIWVNLLNPKVALFFLAFLPQFVNSSAQHFALNIILLGLVFNLCGTTVNLIVSLFFGTLGGWIQGKPRLHKIKGWFSGLIYILLGIGIAISKK